MLADFDDVPVDAETSYSASQESARLFLAMIERSSQSEIHADAGDIDLVGQDDDGA